MGEKSEKWNQKSSFGSIVNQCHHSWNLLLEESQVESFGSLPKVSYVINIVGTLFLTTRHLCKW